jgi:probable F420-dependent oxidoreductase
LIDIGRIGVWTFQLGMASESEQRDAVAELESLGYGAIWVPTFGVFEVVPKLLAAGTRIAAASGIASIYQYDAATVLENARSLDAAYPGRFLLGLGVSHPEAVNRDGSGRYSKPVESMRTFLDELGAELAERSVLAALRSRMLTLARDKTAGAHPYFVPVEHTARARETLGPHKLLAPEQAVVLETDPDTARTIARQHMSLYLQLQNYCNSLRSLGWSEDDIAAPGSDALVDAIVAWGDAGAIRERIQKHHDNGADHVCIQVLRTDQRALPLDEWRAIASV